MDGAVDARPPKPHLKSYRLKQLYRIRQNLWALLRRSPRGSALFLTLNFDEWDDPHDSVEAQRRLRKAATVLDHLFVEWFLVLEFDSGSGRPHYHGIAIARQNVARGWAHEPYEVAIDIRRRAKKERRKLSEHEATLVETAFASLTPNKHLQHVWQVLREELPAFGFGAAHSTPLQKWSDGIAYFIKGLKNAGPPPPLFRRGTRLFVASKSFSSVCEREFSWNTPRMQLQRRRQSRIAGALRLTPEQCMAIMGPKWQWRMNKLLGALHALEPYWEQYGNQMLEECIINSLVGLDESWASALAEKLRERRHLGVVGLPAEPAAPVVFPSSGINAEILAARSRQRSHFGLLPTHPS